MSDEPLHSWGEKEARYVLSSIARVYGETDPEFVARIRATHTEADVLRIFGEETAGFYREKGAATAEEGELMFQETGLAGEEEDEITQRVLARLVGLDRPPRAPDELEA